jgi:hypothetical protein
MAESQKLQQNNTDWNNPISVSTLERVFQDWCLKPLRHPSCAVISKPYHNSLMERIGNNWAPGPNLDPARC